MKELKQYIKLYIRHYKYFLKYGGVSLLVYIFAGISIYLLYPFKLLIQGLFVDAVIDYYNNPSFIRFLNYTLPAPMSYMAMWLFIVILKQIALWIKQVSYDTFRVKVYNNFVSADLVKHIHKFNLAEIERNEIFDKLETFKSYWWNASLIVISKTIDFFGAIFSIVLTFFTIQHVSWWIISIAMGLPVVSFIVKYIEDKKYREFVESIAIILRKRSYLVSVLLDIRTFMERKVNSLYKYLRKLLETQERILRQEYKKHLVKRDNSEGFWGIFDIALLSLLQFYVVTISIIERMQVGAIWANVNYINNFHSKSLLLLSVTGDIISNLRYVKDLYDIYDMKGFADSKYGTRSVKAFKSKAPSLELRELTFKFKQDRSVVLKHVSLKISSGERILILGKDGAGKTAFVKILTTLFPVPENTYFINNIPVQDFKRGQVKNIFSLVPEDFGRYYIPFKENIVLGDIKKNVNKKQYELALEITGLDEWLKETKIDTEKVPLGTYFYPGIELPSGVWQRIAIARAIYRDRSIFILDEPFSYIDGASENKIFKNLIDYLESKNKTLIYIGEDIGFLKYFDSVYEKLKTGQLINISKAKALKEWGS